MSILFRRSCRKLRSFLIQFSSSRGNISTSNAHENRFFVSQSVQAIFLIGAVLAKDFSLTVKQTNKCYTRTTVMTSLKEGKLDRATIALGSVAIWLPWRSKGHVGWKGSHWGRLGMSRIEPLGSQDGCGKFYTKIKSSGDVAFHDKVISTLKLVEKNKKK